MHSIPGRFPFHFLYLVMVLSHHLSKIYITVNLLDLLSINNQSSLLTCLLHIILVFEHSCVCRQLNMSCSFDLEFAWSMNTVVGYVDN